MSIVAGACYAFNSSASAMTRSLRDQTGESLYTVANIVNRGTGGPFSVGRYAQASNYYDYVGLHADSGTGLYPTTGMLEGWFTRNYVGGGHDMIVPYYEGSVLHCYLATVAVTGSTYMFAVYNGSGSLVAQTTSSYLLNKWYCLALKIFVSDAGSALLYVGPDYDTPVINVSGAEVDTRNRAGELIDPVYGLAAPITHIGWGGNGDWNPGWSDVIVKDPFGTRETDLFGCQHRMVPLSPNADGADTGMTPLSGSDHFAMVNGQPVLTSTYLSTTSAGIRDCSKFPALGVTGTVVAAIPYQEMTKTDTATRKVKPYVRDAAGNFDYADEINLGIAVEGHSRIIYTDPAGAALTTNSFGANGIQIGEETTV